MYSVEESSEQLFEMNVEKYLLENEHKELLRFITCGNVDDGKSTLIGKLLYDGKVIYEDQLKSIVKDSKRMSHVDDDIDLSLLLDGLQSEREQGITIDVAYRFFSTQKRKFIIADTPGHEQYTRNMVTGASTADMAIILIDARHGVQVQTKRHSFISKLLGIKHFIVAINKMDLVEYSQEVYFKIKKDYIEFSKEMGLSHVDFVPISALKGDNIVTQSEHMGWYKGNTLMYDLENINISEDRNSVDFRFPVQYVNRSDFNVRGFSGTIASGSISVKDEIIVLLSQKTSKIKNIISYDGDLNQAFFGMAVTLTLEDEIDISRGDIIIKKDDTPRISNKLDADIVWMNDIALELGNTYYIKQCTKQVQGTIEFLHYKKDMNTLEETLSDSLCINEIAYARIQLSQNIVFDNYSINRQTGRFIIIDRISNNTVGVGMIRVEKEGESPQNNKNTHIPSFFEKRLHLYVKKKYPHWEVKDI